MRPPKFWSADRPGFCGRAAAVVLAPLGALYGAITAYRAARPSTWRAPVPVICIGNVVMGGAGKTLVCIDLARRLREGGHTPHVLLRGYGGSLQGPALVDANTHSVAETGDEALLLARAAPTWVGRDRTATAKCATEAGATVILMDDGFQNPALAKTVSLLVIDGTFGFGNNRVFPAGPLREPVQGAVVRADALVVIGGESAPFAALIPACPTFTATIAPDAGPVALDGKPVFAFAGIGRPEKFFQTLHAAGAEIRRTVAYPDHHVFSAAELTALIADAAAAGCTVVTTAKDHVRLPAQLRDRITAVPVHLEWSDADAVARFIVDRAGLE